MCPNWVSCCAPWLDIPAGCSVVLSGPMMGTHCIQPIAFVTECRRFGLMQFSSSSFRSLFWHFAYSATPDRFFLLVANLVFAALRMWRRVGRVWHCSVCAKLSLISTLSLPSFLGSFRLSSCLLRICFESTVGAFLNNLLLFDIWSEWGCGHFFGPATPPALSFFGIASGSASPASPSAFAHCNT